MLHGENAVTVMPELVFAQSLSHHQKEIMIVSDLVKTEAEMDCSIAM